MSTREEIICRVLETVMSDISERAYAAGWMADLEFDLWAILQGQHGPHYGMTQVTDDEIAELRLLSELCGGWTCPDGPGRDEGYIPLADWIPLYEAHRAKCGAGGA